MSSVPFYTLFFRELVLLQNYWAECICCKNFVERIPVIGSCACTDQTMDMFAGTESWLLSLTLFSRKSSTFRGSCTAKFYLSWRDCIAKLILYRSANDRSQDDLGFSSCDCIEGSCSYPKDNACSANLGSLTNPDSSKAHRSFNGRVRMRKTEIGNIDEERLHSTYNLSVSWSATQLKSVYQNHELHIKNKII